MIKYVRYRVSSSLARDLNIFVQVLVINMLLPALFIFHMGMTE